MAKSEALLHSANSVRNWG